MSPTIGSLCRMGTFILLCAAATNWPCCPSRGNTMIRAGCRGRFRPGLYVLMIFCIFARGDMALAIVLHPEGEPNPHWLEKPHDEVVGRWGTNASCVAVSPNYLVTTRHQGGGVDTTVYFGGMGYRVKQIWNEPSADGYSADLRVCRIENLMDQPANLSRYVAIQTDPNELDQPVVFGGFGMGRGEALVNGRTIYGYTWAGTDNTIQRWGENRIEQTGVVEGTYTSEVIIADFDALGGPDAMPFEAALALWDSGGGWFTHDGLRWKVAGLSRGVGQQSPGPLEQSWFSPPDYLDAVRISSYADWIQSVIVEPYCSDPAPADLNQDCRVNMADLFLLRLHWLRDDCDSANDWCDRADQPPRDHQVNLRDFALLASHWLECSLLPDWACD